MKIHGKPCNTTECTLTIVIIYLSVIIPSFFGFEGSRRATANATCAKFCYHFQVRTVRTAEDWILAKAPWPNKTLRSWVNSIPPTNMD